MAVSDIAVMSGSGQTLIYSKSQWREVISNDEGEWVDFSQVICFLGGTPKLAGISELASRALGLFTG